MRDRCAATNAFVGRGLGATAAAIATHVAIGALLLGIAPRGVERAPEAAPSDVAVDLDVATGTEIPAPNSPEANVTPIAATQANANANATSGAARAAAQIAHAAVEANAGDAPSKGGPRALPAAEPAASSS